MTIHVQFKDSTETAIVAVFNCEQDCAAYPFQGAIEDSDSRYVAYLQAFSGAAVDARRLRDAKLADCDWTVGSDSPLSVVKKTAWVAYRKALRDVPSQSGFPSEITWPVAP